MEENDLEAIDALNSLSNSPARALLKKPAPNRGKKDEKKSFFSKVLGGSHESKPKKKRKLDF